MVVFDIYAQAHNRLANAKLIDILPKFKIFCSDFNLHSPQQNPKSNKLTINPRTNRTYSSCLLKGSYPTSTSELSKDVSTLPKDYVSDFLLTRTPISNKEIPKKPNKLKKSREITELITNMTP